MMETEAAGYPQEVANRRSLLSSQVEEAPIKIATEKENLETLKQERQQNAELHPAVLQQHKLEASKTLLDYADKIMEDVDSPEEYNRRRDYAIQQQSETANVIDPLTPEASTLKGFQKHQEDQFKSRNALRLKLEDMQNQTQVKVANIQAQGGIEKATITANKKDYNKLTAGEKVRVMANAKKDYDAKYVHWIPNPDNPNMPTQVVDPKAPPYDDDYINDYLSKTSQAATGTSTPSWQDYLPQKGAATPGSTFDPNQLQVPARAKRLF
jgi:hypothetical protein